MLNEHTVEQLKSLRTHGMVRAIEEQATSTAADALSFDDRLTLMVQREVAWRDDRPVARRYKRPNDKGRPADGARGRRFSAALSTLHRFQPAPNPDSSAAGAVFGVPWGRKKGVGKSRRHMFQVGSGGRRASRSGISAS